MVCALEEKSCESFDYSSEQIEGLGRFFQEANTQLAVRCFEEENLHLAVRCFEEENSHLAVRCFEEENLHLAGRFFQEANTQLAGRFFQEANTQLAVRCFEEENSHLEVRCFEEENSHLAEITQRFQKLPALLTTRIAFFLLVLLVLFQNHNVKNKYIKSCRKYNSLDSILYLLCQSGDIELNPGPATYIKYRQWLKDACVSVLKGIVGVHSNSKPRNVWKQPPNCWPSIDKPFFDPNNSNRKVKEIECLLDTLIRCWKQSNINIDPDIQQEIRLWERKRDDKDLLKKYNMRKIMKKVEMAINSLKMNSEDLEIEIEDKTCIIEIFFHSDDEQTQGLVLYKSEAIRRLTCLLFKIYNNKDPETKSDKIWVPTNKPVEWSKDVRFYNPNNGGKREKDGEDEELLGEVIKCIERKNIEEIYQKMISAWKTGDIESLSKLLVFYKATTDLKAAVKTMVAENLLDSMRQDIKRLGLSVSVKNVDKKRKYTEKSQRQNKKQKQSTSQSCSPSCSSKDELLMIDNSEGDNTETDDWTTLKGINWSDEGIEDTDIDFLNDVFSF